MIDIGWPEFIWLLITVIGFGVHCARDGEPKDDRYNAFTYLVAWVLLALLLWWGGFF